MAMSLMRTAEFAGTRFSIYFSRVLHTQEVRFANRIKKYTLFIVMKQKLKYCLEIKRGKRFYRLILDYWEIFQPIKISHWQTAAEAPVQWHSCV